VGGRQAGELQPARQGPRGLPLTAQHQLSGAQRGRPRQVLPPDERQRPRAAYDDLLTRHGFVDIGSVQLTPMHALTYGRRPADP
jgi:hypothetical protein